MTSAQIVISPGSIPPGTEFFETLLAEKIPRDSPKQTGLEPHAAAFRLQRTVSGDKRNEAPLPAKPKDWEKIQDKRRRCNDKVNKSFEDCRERKLGDPKMVELQRKSDEVMKKYEEKEKLNGGSLKPEDYRKRHKEVQALRDQYGDSLRSCHDNEQIERKRCNEEFKREMEK
jgi:hypothetical protein